MNKTKFLLAFNLSVALFVALASCKRAENLEPGNISVPHERSIHWNTESAFSDSIQSVWANKTVQHGPEKGKVDNPRILLAQLHAETNPAQTNQVLMNMKPWGVSGSSWALNKRGDYDFTLTVLTTILWQFGHQPQLLFPETRDHLLNVLLVEDGNNFRSTAPKTLGLAPETENHILMTEGSRYLKNRWLFLHGDEEKRYNNLRNGMETKILEVLNNMQTNGLYEFNSMPYEGYTITALLNLEAFGSEKVALAAQNVLDYMNFCFALGSYHYQYFPPMRRRYERASWHELTTAYHAVFMKAWMSFLPDAEPNFDIGQGQAHALLGACMPYRPADEITRLLFDKGQGYFVKLGHGRKACPEIYSAGKDFLLSAGGANRGKKSQIVARPITLFLNNDARNLQHTVHLAGPGTDFRKWNNTGVYKNFACAAGKVVCPPGWVPCATAENWSVYEFAGNLCIATFSGGNLGIIVIFEGGEPREIVQDLIQANPDSRKLTTQFQFPNGDRIEYDVYAPKNKWVLTKINKTELNRDFDSWPLISGNFQ